MNIRKSKKQYIVNINSRRSIQALVAAAAVTVATFIPIVESIVTNADQGADAAFHFFTVLSCMLSATGALFMIPYAIEGIRKKRFSMPKWVGLFQYSGAVSVVITMFCSATLISFALGPYYAFGGVSFWLHLVVPILSIVLFCAVESGHPVTKKDMILVQIPFWTYSIIYFIMVVIIGEENGGWPDFYMATSILPIWIVGPMLLAIGFGASALLRFFHNNMIKRIIKGISSQWPEDISPVELRIEALGLGRYMAGSSDENELIIPIDLLRLMARKCNLPIEDIVKAYTKGLLDGIKEREETE